MQKESIYSNKLINDILDKYDYLDTRDKAFIKRCFEGSVERRIELDYHIGNFSSVPVNKMKPLIRNLLRMSAYQIIYMDNVPDSAVINEAVKLAKKRKFSNLSGFVNGNLRNLSRNKDNLKWPSKDKQPVSFLSIKYSVPEWIVEKWMKIYDYDKTEKILAGLLEVHPVTLRFKKNLDKQKIEELVNEIKAQGAEIIGDDRLPFVYHVTHMDGARNLPGYDEGYFTIQDISSTLAVEAAGIKEGDFVIDACAAPGGKSLLASENAGKSGKVLSRDVSEAKIDKIQENIDRLGAANVFTKVWDASCFDEQYEEKADVLILDVPCSGLGILGKKRDIKYNASIDGLKELVSLQEKIVDNSWKYVKKGGILLYSTCTINPDENENQVARITSKLPFKLVSGPVQFLPGADRCDGFFYAVLKREN